ncbi:MAG: hypothetical protein M1835_000054 [Candelina submexicana]|nr:MAG: hypothetical protein M1835_000054 [Candelina submexicana]
MFFFGPDSGPLDLPNEDVDEDSFGQPQTVIGKHGREDEFDGPESEQPAQRLSKKTRRSKSHGAESIEANDHGDAMEIDRNGYSHAGPSPKADTPSPPSLAAEADVAQALQDLQEPEPTNTLTNGNSVGVQSDKVVELGPETSLFLDLDETKAGNSVATTDATTNMNGRDAAGHDPSSNGVGGIGGVGPRRGSVSVSTSTGTCSVTHLAWNPRDAAILATAGDALSRIWNLTALASTTQNSHMTNGNGFDSTAQTNGHTPSIQSNDYKNLVGPSERSLITACSWSPDGETLAVATRDLTADWDGEATTWSKDGQMLHVLPAGHDMILSLEWNPVGSLLLGIATNGQGSTILLWDSSTGQHLTDLNSGDNMKDAAWMTETDFICCGDGRMIRCRTGTNGAVPAISVVQDIETEVKWLNLKCDVAHEVIAITAEEDGVIGVARGSADLSVHMAHEAPITRFEFRPAPKWLTEASNTPSYLLTASTDGNVRLWKIDDSSFEMMQNFSMGASVPAMAADFSPDGSLIAAASYRRLLIWDVEKASVPIASWNPGTEQWPTEEEVMETGSSDDHLLKWQVDGGRLAYGLGNRLAIIAFER